MSMQDPIADMLTRIRNSFSVNKSIVSFPYSKQKKAISDILLQEGYIESFDVVCTKVKNIEIKLKYYEGTSVIETLKRVSRPGLRVYKTKGNLPKSCDGFGIVIVSTSRGLMNDRQARIAGIGGEIVCYVA